MELDLCLALPNHTPNMNLNCTSSSSSSNNGFEKQNKGHEKYGPKNIFLENEYGYVDHEVESKALPLLSWNDHPNGEDDESQSEKWRNLQIHDHEENNEEIVGWPPINSLRKELLHGRQGQGGWMANHRPEAAHRHVDIARRNSMYVKVKMEGVGIGRKIDLRLHNSYQALSEFLIHMFDKYNKNDGRNAGDYTISYQDKEGDWMLAGDVPWESFIESVQRIEILRNEN